MGHHCWKLLFLLWIIIYTKDSTFIQTETGLPPSLFRIIYGQKEWRQRDVMAGTWSLRSEMAPLLPVIWYWHHLISLGFNFLIWEMGLRWGLNKIMPPVENGCSKLTHIYFFLHKFGAMIPMAIGGNRCDRWWWDWVGDLSFTGVKSTGLLGQDSLVLSSIFVPPHSIPSSMKAESWLLWGPVSLPPY